MASYATKSTWKTKSIFDCRVLTATANLRKLAQEEYEADQEGYWVAVEPHRVFPKLFVSSGSA